MNLGTKALSKKSTRDGATEKYHLKQGKKFKQPSPQRLGLHFLKVEMCGKCGGYLQYNNQ